MNHRRQGRAWVLMFTFAVAILALLTWGNYQYVRQNPGGNDFLPRWLGTRLLVFQGLSPYSDETALEIQKMAYGRPVRAGEDEMRMAYPLYSIVLFLPYALIGDFSLARALWMTTLEVAIILLSLLSIHLTTWRPSLPMLTSFLIFSLFWYHGLRPLINGNAVALVALCIVGAFWAIRKGADELAGVLLAFSTIKPQLALLPIVFISLYALWQRRWRLVFWLIGTIILLSLGAALLLPDWILQNLREVLRYPLYTPPGTLQAALRIWFPLFGNRLGWAITGILTLMLLFEWRLAFRAEFRHFLWTACLTLTISQWIGIQTDPGNFIVLMPALVLVFAVWEERWKRAGRLFAIVTILLIFLGIWSLFLATVEYGYQPQQSPAMFLPLPGFLLLALYWVRWWAVRAPQVWFDLLEEF
ncbi:MAG: glycosyltransferase family 87 protein [Anaerolineales bacterium]